MKNTPSPIMRMMIASPADIKADLRKNKKPIFAVILFLLVYIIVMGVIYSFVEHITFLRSFYFTVINVTTVGFGDVVPFTRIGKLIAGFNSLAGLIIFGVLVATLTMALQPRQFSGEITPIQTEPPDEPLADGLNKLFAGVGAVLTASKLQRRETDESNLAEPDDIFRVGITVHDHPRRLGRWGHIHIDLSVRNDA